MGREVISTSYSSTILKVLLNFVLTLLNFGVRVARRGMWNSRRDGKQAFIKLAYLDPRTHQISSAMLERKGCHRALEPGVFRDLLVLPQIE